MNSRDDRPDPAASSANSLPAGAPQPEQSLRKRAEEFARKNAPQSLENHAVLSPEEIGNTLHELRVHQIELEMQSEELRRLQVELESARAKYFDLYDLAPVGYFTVSDTGLILDANLAAATMLGVSRSAFADKFLSSFVLREDQEKYYLFRKLLIDAGTQLCEMRLVTKAGSAIWVSIEATMSHAADGELVSRVVMSDITARKQAEDAIAAATGIKLSILESISDAFFALNEDMIVTYYNRAAEKALGKRQEDVIGRRLFDVFWEAKGSIFEENYTKALKEQKALTFEAFFGMPYENWYDVRVLPHDDGIAVYFQLITDRKQAEDKIARLLERLNLATGAAHLGIWDWDIRKNELHWDDRMYELYGVKKEDFGGAYEAWIAGVHPDDRIASHEASERARRGDRDYDTEFRVVWPDGSIRVLKAHGIVVRDSEGKPLRMTGINYDITVQKQTEEALRTNERMLQTIIDTEPECIKILDEQANLIMMNRAGLDMIQVESLEQVKGQCLCPIITSEYRAAFMDLAKRVFQGESGKLEFEIIGAKGRHLWLETYAVPLQDKDDKVTALLGVTRDVTEQRRTEQERDKLIADLQKALAEIKTLKGILPICSICKKIRDDKDAWKQMEVFISEHSEAAFSHGYCPDCAKTAQAEIDKFLKNKPKETV